MSLNEYTLQRAKLLNQINLSAFPFEITLLWFDLLCAKNMRSSICLDEHSHTFHEIHFVFSGEAYYQCNGRNITLCENQALYIPPGIQHKYCVCSSNMYKASLAYSEKYGLIRKKEGQKFNFSERVTENTNMILMLSEKNNNFSAAIIIGRIMEILYTVFEDLQLVIPKSSIPDIDVRVSVAKSFIEKNLHRNINSNDVAKECCLSTKQMGRIFKSETGCSVFSYITESKINYSKRLLLQNRYSIKEISYMTGFENESSFVSFFKRRCGMPPGMYREKNSEKCPENKTECP